MRVMAVQEVEERGGRQRLSASGERASRCLDHEYLRNLVHDYLKKHLKTATVQPESFQSILM